jgi:CRISPR-associated protein Cmr2
MFSKLMEKLRAEIPEDAIISPATRGNKDIGDVGLYPDRIYFKNPGNGWDINKVIDCVKVNYADEIVICADYFRIYAVEIEADGDEDIIKKLNERLDCLELCNIALPQDTENSVFNSIIGNKIWTKYHKSGKQIETLAEIASAQLEQIDENGYKKCLSQNKGQDNEDKLIKELKNKFPEKFITPHKYICIVHADGDNIGTIAGSVTIEELKTLSQRLLKFGDKACESIKQYQGFPIYAGGDDLLFIAPVVSGKEETRTIFDLIKQIDDDFKETKVSEITGKDNKGNTLVPAMSYGISITYYKYPLYESLEMSRNLLFGISKELKKKDEKGKDTDEKLKNAIAWTLQRGSGATVTGVFSKGSENSKDSEKLYEAYQSLIKSINVKTDKNLVSAVAHKIKNNEELLGLFMGTANQDERLVAFFKNYLEYETKKADEKIYLDAVKGLFKVLQSTTNNIKETTKIIYAMLRTAKFIKGLEDDKDE